MNPDEIRVASLKVFDRVVSYREHLHMYPELSFEEFETMEFVSSKLTEIGIPHQKGVGQTGIVALIKADKNPDRWMGLRSDLDALPILEQNELSYKSKNDGVMHACGHDVHTSILLGAAEILWNDRQNLPISVKLIFQPGEELSPGGATLMIDAGVLDDPKMESMVALHVFPEMNVGSVGIKSGLYMASSDEIHIDIKGVGGHGALPEKCINPIEIASHIVINAPKIISDQKPKEVPTVLSFGKIEGLGSTNVIPSTCTLKGTFRTMDEQWREKFFSELIQFLNQLEKEYNADVKLHRVKGYPFLVNDEKVTSHVKNALITQLGTKNVHDLPIRMTAEDFAFYSQVIPVCFFRIGVGNPLKEVNHGVHHPQFDIHNDALKVGVESLLSIVYMNC